jgi:hypothetical protein
VAECLGQRAGDDGHSRCFGSEMHV